MEGAEVPVVGPLSRVVDVPLRELLGALDRPARQAVERVRASVLHLPDAPVAKFNSSI